MPQEVIPARVTTLMYTNEQEKLEYTHRIRKIGLPGRHADSMYSSVQRLLHWQICHPDSSSSSCRRAVLKEINDKPKSDSGFSFRTSTRFHLKIPLSFSHVNHPVRDLSTIGQYVDKRVVDKFYDLINQNITNFSELQRSLDKYVREDLFSGHPEERRPKKTNRRYYPCRQEVRNHIAKAISAVKYYDDDQEALGKLMAN